jgi:predicted TIM-barrel fold metal-dependent hydrolase
VPGTPPDEVPGTPPDDGPEAIVDAHHHLWDLGRFRYPWLSGDAAGPPPGPLPASYQLQEFRRDIDGLPVTGSVQVEAGRDDAVAEARWLADLAAEAGPVSVVVARVRLGADDVAAQLAELSGSRRVSGVREVLNFSGSAAGRPSYAAPRPDLMDDPGWRRGLARVQDAGLTFDLQVEPGQLAQASRLAADFGGLTFVLDHGGYMTRRSASTDEIWRAGIRALARLPNVAVKACDYSTVDPSFSPLGFADFVRELVDVFGPGRTMFASNFPGEGLTISYRRLVRAFGRAIAILPAGARSAIWAGNAIRLYRIGDIPADTASLWSTSANILLKGVVSVRLDGEIGRRDWRVERHRPGHRDRTGAGWRECGQPVPDRSRRRESHRRADRPVRRQLAHAPGRHVRCCPGRGIRGGGRGGLGADRHLGQQCRQGAGAAVP